MKPMTWSVALLLVVGVACGKSNKSGLGSGTASGAPPDLGSNPGSATSPGSAAHGSAADPGVGSAVPRGTKTAVVEAGECPTGMAKVTEPINIAGATLSFERDRGGGCATKPVYTAIFKKADPMPVAVCFDPSADMCEMFIKAEKVSIDLTEALKAAGAKSASLMK